GAATWSGPSALRHSAENGVRLGLLQRLAWQLLVHPVSVADRGLILTATDRRAVCTRGSASWPRWRRPPQIHEVATKSGLRLEARYANWQKDSFGADSTDHISVYRKPSRG